MRSVSIRRKRCRRPRYDLNHAGTDHDHGGADYDYAASHDHVNRGAGDDVHDCGGGGGSCRLVVVVRWRRLVGLAVRLLPAGVPSLAASLRGPDAVSWAIPVVATNALLALLLVLLMPFPGELFNRTLDEHYDEVTGWFRRLVPGGRSERSSERRSRVRGSWWTLGLVLVAGTLLAGLLDPGFGWNRSTGALLVGAGLGLLGVMAVGLGVSAWFVRRRDTGVSLSVRALPGALVVAAACVLLSRVVGFEPGYLYGVLAGLVVGGALSAVDEGKQAALASGVTALVALAAWLGWTWLQPSLGSDPSFGLTVVDTALATLFVAGLEGLVFGLVPMRFLAGAQVLKWSKLVWGLLFGAGVFAFLQLLAHPGAGYGPTESAVPFLTAAALFAGFGLVSVGFWGWFRIRDRRQTPQPAQPTPEQA